MKDIFTSDEEEKKEKKEKEDKKGPAELVSFLNLVCSPFELHETSESRGFVLQFRFADRIDLGYMLIGTIAGRIICSWLLYLKTKLNGSYTLALAHGATFPLSKSALSRNLSIHLCNISATHIRKCHGQLYWSSGVAVQVESHVKQQFGANNYDVDSLVDHLCIHVITRKSGSSSRQWHSIFSELAPNLQPVTHSYQGTCCRLFVNSPYGWPVRIDLLTERRRVSCVVQKYYHRNECRNMFLFECPVCC